MDNGLNSSSTRCNLNSNTTPRPPDAPLIIDSNPLSEYINLIALIEKEPKSYDSFVPLQKLISQICEPEDLIIGSDYTVILIRKKRDDKQIADFVPVLLEVVEEHTVEKTTFFYKLLILSADEHPKTIKVESSKIDCRNWIDDLGPRYILKDGHLKNIKSMLQRMSKYAPLIIEYAYSGWLLNGDNTYIIAGQQISASNWDPQSCKDSFVYALSMLDIAPRTLTISLLSIALLSLTQSRQILTGDYFKGVCCIEAQTQSFKTTLASLFFDFQKGREADINFEATSTAIVRTIGNCRDSVTIVDDYKPGASRAESSDMVKKLSTLIRMTSDDSGGIQKAGAQNTTISNVAQGLVVVTAEQIQLDVQSTIARLLIFELNKKEVDLVKLTDFQEHHDRYLGFIRNYIAYIASQGVNNYCNELAYKFRKERYTLRHGLQKKNILADNRTSDMCTWLWIIYREFLTLSLNIGAISREKYDSGLEEARMVFLEIMETQARRVACLSPVEIFFNGLQILIDTKEIRIPELKARNTSFTVPESKEAIGFLKGNSIYLKNGVAFQAVVDYHRRHGKDFTISEAAFRKILANAGYIIRNGNGYFIKRLSVNCEHYSCIEFEKNIFYKLLHGGNYNEQESVTEVPSDRALRETAAIFAGGHN